jgi:AcrR family transcriptional regulator
VAEAARALSEAAAGLTQALSDGLSASKSQVSAAVADGLREAAHGLAAATDDAFNAAARLSNQRRGARQAATRARLLDAAAQLIAERGYAGASVGDIAAAAGFTKGAFYAHFASKEELFAQLAAQRLADQAAGLRVCPTEADPSQSKVTPGRLWDQVLNLEIMAFALREPAFGRRLGPAWADVLAAAGRLSPAQADHSETAGDPPDGLDLADLVDSASGEVAVALLALLSAGRVLAAVLDLERAADLTQRMVARLFRGV